MDAKEEAVSDNLSKKERKPFVRFWRLGFFCVILSITIAAGLWRSVADSRKKCDRAASSDVGIASAVLERLGDEIVNFGMTYDRDQCLGTIAATNALRYLAGPHYGWTGGSRKCQVLFRVIKVKNKWQLQCAALRGSQPAGPGSRYVFIPAVAGESRPAEIMYGIVDARNGSSGDWNAYPYHENPAGPEICYTESIVDRTKKPSHGQAFVLRVPKSVHCDQIPHTAYGW